MGYGAGEIGGINSPAGAGVVDSVTNSDGSITVLPTTGNVVIGVTPGTYIPTSLLTTGGDLLTAYGGVTTETTPDASGYDNALLLVGTAPTVGTSPWSGFGDAFTFSGTNNGDTSTGMSGGPSNTGVPGVSGVGTNAEFTLEARIETGVSVTGLYAIAGRYSSSTAVGGAQPVLVIDNGVPGVGFRDNTGVYKAANGGTVTTSTEYEIAASYDGTTVRLYINGTEVEGLAASGVETPDTVTRFFIGRDDDIGQASNGGYPFNGIIDEVRWSNTARYTGSSYSPSATPFTTDANTLGLWHLDALNSSTTPLTLERFGVGSATVGQTLTYMGAQSSDPSGFQYDGPWVPSDGSGGALLNGAGETTTTQFTLRARTGISYPVPVLRPTVLNTNLALDLMPNGSPSDSGNGYTWIDVCDTDLQSVGTGEIGTARIAVHASTVEFGNWSYSGSTAKSVVLTVNSGTTGFQLDPNYNVFIGKQAALAASATNGFASIPSGPGIPTGTPGTIKTGLVPLYLDTTNGVLDAYIGSAWAGLNMPWQVPLFFYATPYSIGQGTWVTETTSNIGTAYMENTSSATGDNATWLVELGAGTYTIDFFYQKYTSNGILTITLDGNSVTTIDTYAASIAQGHTQVTGVTVTGSKAHSLEVLINTKNASSSSYECEIVCAIFTRTA
jgi:Concanavalin A-like lectin/glucanases superfamily